jgi:glycosyltransferase involved in cell wall biosynthesis
MSSLLQIKRPRILFLSYHIVQPHAYGAKLRAVHIARILKQCGDLQVVGFSLGQVSEKAYAEARREFALETSLQLVRQPIRGARHRWRREVDPWFLNTHGWSLSGQDRSHIDELIESSDLVWFHSVLIPNAAGITRCSRAVLDIDDVPSQVSRTEALRAKSWGERFLAWRHVWQWRRREALFAKRFNLLTVCSEGDYRYLRSPDRVRVIPNGFDLPETNELRQIADPPRIGFIGPVSYPPNLEGVQWFIDQVWPHIKKNCPRARFRLVGAGTSSDFGALGQDIEGLGWIEDAAAEIRTWTLMVVPIQTGGGTRIKIAEAFGRRCPVVSTSLGAFGYAVKSGEEILLADRPTDFANACLMILQSKQLGETLASRAWDKFIRYWTWEAIAPHVHSVVEECLCDSRSGGGESFNPPHRAETDREANSRSGPARDNVCSTREQSVSPG